MEGSLAKVGVVSGEFCQVSITIFYFLSRNSAYFCKSILYQLSLPIIEFDFWAL